MFKENTPYIYKNKKKKQVFTSRLNIFDLKIGSEKQLATCVPRHDTVVVVFVTIACLASDNRLLIFSATWRRSH
jgi:hypothetical protein